MPRKTFGGAMTVFEAKEMRKRRRPGSPLARKNLKTLFKSALGTFPARRHRGTVKRRKSPMRRAGRI